MFIDTHHIVPKYEGGTDDPTNLVKLPRKLHQEVHYRRWLVYKNISDLYAFQLLGGNLSDEELIKIYEDQVSRCKRDSEKLTETRLKSEKWKQSHQSNVYKQKKREQSILLNQLGKINSKQSSELISQTKRSVKNYNSKNISVYGKIWEDAVKCIRNGGSGGLTLRQLRYRANNENYPDIYYVEVDCGEN
jgi:polyribonucleotide nucleotidyltransferase